VQGKEEISLNIFETKSNNGESKYYHKDKVPLPASENPLQLDGNEENQSAITFQFYKNTQGRS
jgi:hypothetical protein